jgi:hypothetical protein
MKADDKFPVAKGTVVTLTCTDGYQIKGDKTVTCTRNTDFDYSMELQYSSVEPSCGENLNIVANYHQTL